jgi:hypothetical protein
MALSKSSSLKQISLFPSEAAGLSAAPAKLLPFYLKDHRERRRERLHGFNGVISAPIDQLLSVLGIGGAVVTVLKTVEAAAHRLSQTRILGRPIFSSWDRL